MAHEVYLSLGANLGEKENNLHEAILMIQEQVGMIVSRSAFYVTSPWGFETENTFLNAVVGVKTEWMPLELLAVTQRIERALGRTHKTVDGAYTDRLIDIDILSFDDLAMQTDVLVLPHPLLHLRRFVLEPLCEIAPDWIHPIMGKSASVLLSEL